MNDYRRGSHSVYLLTYHIIFVTKYRKRVITNEMGDFMKKLVNMLKSGLSKEVHLKYREHIQKYLYGDAPFWSHSYFCATTGSVSMETVKKYIEEQRTDEHHRKYVLSGKYSKSKR